MAKIRETYLPREYEVQLHLIRKNLREVEVEEEREEVIEGAVEVEA